jgi:hypothetical protein
VYYNPGRVLRLRLEYYLFKSVIILFSLGSTPVMSLEPASGCTITLGRVSFGVYYNPGRVLRLRLEYYVFKSVIILFSLGSTPGMSLEPAWVNFGVYYNPG